MVQSENILTVENLYVSYDKANIVRNVSFDLKNRNFWESWVRAAVERRRCCVR